MAKELPESWWKRAERKANEDAFGDRLRRRIVGMLHSGRLHFGDRLPSIRTLGEQYGVNHRVIADAYRALEDVGLVEIRPKVGVFVAANGKGAASGEEQTVWLTQILFDAWERGMARSSILDLVHRGAERRLRCGCIESNEDHMVALTSELESDFSLHAVPLFVAACEHSTLSPERLDNVDLVVTSMFHIDAARVAAAEANKPMVVATFNPEFTREIDRRLSEHPITTVYVDPEYAIRGREYLAVTPHWELVRFVELDQLQDRPVDLHAGDVMVTRAARRQLGLEEYHLIPDLKVISPEAAQTLCGVIAEISLR